MHKVNSFENYVDFLIVRLGPDVSGTLSRMNNVEFDLDFEIRLSYVFRRRNHIGWQDALLLSENLFSEEGEKLSFLKLVKGAKSCRLEMEAVL